MLKGEEVVIEKSAQGHFLVTALMETLKSVLPSCIV